MTASAASTTHRSRPLTVSEARGLPLTWIAAALLAWIAFDNVLLWGFLGLSLPQTIGVAIVTAAAIAGLVIRAVPQAEHTRITLRTLFICLGLAVLLLILGGEGRFLYANADWQIRDAVLRDMGSTAWPYVIRYGGIDHILRAPLGMYLKPALIGGTSQIGRDLALTGCNAVLLTGIFALGSALFETARARLIAFAIFFVFSGMDIIGTIVAGFAGYAVSFDHLELWINKSQFSSHITMMFWVPQHAMAGWLCAVLFLLWQRGKLAVGPFAAAIPMLAIWSPLAIMGAVPFAAIAGLTALGTRSWRWVDVGLTVCALAIAAGSLVYLHAGAEGVAMHFTKLTALEYATVLLLEIIPLAAILWTHRRSAGLGRVVPFVTIAALILMPLFCIGDAIDFQMRASIVPLAILAIGISTLIAQPGALEPGGRRLVIILLAIGALTPLMEVRRAIATKPAPPPQCAMIDAWYAQSGTIVSPASYYARLDQIPPHLRPVAAARITQTAKAQCWDREWDVPRF